LGAFLQRFITEDEIAEAFSGVQGELFSIITKKLKASEVDDQIAHLAVAHVMQKM
jgi:hypothetical protein